LYLDLSGHVTQAGDNLSALSDSRRRRDYALQESVDTGEPYLFRPAPGVATWVIGLEDRRMIHGGLIGGEVRVRDEAADATGSIDYLVTHGMSGDTASRFLSRLQVWPEDRVHEAAHFLQQTFYDISGWNPELMRENRLRVQRQRQISQAIEDQRKRGDIPLYAFENERRLLANIRAGDRTGARRILNDMLATIYLSSPQLVVLRARTVELLSCLTRAAIEDNPLMEPLIEQNHAWTERLVRARSFEELSELLMDTLDDFIDGIYLHGYNRSNRKVRMALDYISRNYMKKISLRDVASEVDLSRCRLAHLVKDLTGRTVLQIVHEARIRQAQRLLERTSRTCTEIAYEVGYEDQSYFIKQFRRSTGTTPSRYRRFRA